jgi:hypothetical protein
MRDSECSTQYNFSDRNPIKDLMRLRTPTQNVGLRFITKILHLLRVSLYSGYGKSQHSSDLIQLGVPTLKTLGYALERRLVICPR